MSYTTAEASSYKAPPDRVPFYERILCSVPDALLATSLGRTKFYALVNAGVIETTHSGRRTLVVVESLKRLANKQTEAVKQAS